MDLVKAETPSLIELYRKQPEIAIANAPGDAAAQCYNSTNSNISSRFIMMFGVKA
jgi:hypothetical protein